MSINFGSLNDRAWSIESDGRLGGTPYASLSQLHVRPVVSLNSEVVLSGGAGTTTNPYTVSLGWYIFRKELILWESIIKREWI